MKKIPLVMMSLLLASCAHLNSDFDCSMKPGIRCESLDRVNARIDRGEIGRPCRKMRCAVISLPAVAGTAHHVQEPLRHGETVQRIWMAPWEDRQGNYHAVAQVFATMRPGHWIGDPPHEPDSNI